MNSLLSFFAGWQVKLLLVVALVFGLYTYHKAEVKIAVNKAVAQVVVDMQIQSSKENFRLKERSLDTQIELQAKADKIQKDKDNEIANLKSRVRILSDSLRDRPTNRQEPNRVSDNPGNPETQTGATGLQLSRPDAELLIWFAGETAELQTELNSCLKKYSIAKETLDKFKRDNTPKTN